METDKNRISSLIKNIRLQQGLTMEEFGARLNTSKGAVNNWEKGVNLPSKDRVKIISEMGNMTVSEFLYGESLEENNLYQYLENKVRTFFKDNDQTLKEKYGMTQTEINSLRNKCINYIDDSYKDITFESEEKKNNTPNYSLLGVNAHPYFGFRELATKALLENIYDFIFAENMSDNPTLNIYGIADYAAIKAGRKVEAYIDFLEKNNVIFDKEISEEILTKVNELSDSLKEIVEKHKLT